MQKICKTVDVEIDIEDSEFWELVESCDSRELAKVIIENSGEDEFFEEYVGMDYRYGSMYFIKDDDADFLQKLLEDSGDDKNRIDLYETLKK